MSLYCGCDDAFPEPGQTWAWWPDDYSEMPVRTRRTRCADRECRKLLNPGDTVLEFVRFKAPETEIEEAIYGESGEIPLASHYLCESCSDQFLNLRELGFCLDHTDVNGALREYRAMMKGE